MLNSVMTRPTHQHFQGCCCCQCQPQGQNQCCTNLGIVPPKDWKPDVYVGLGPQLSPEEKLKKKYQDLMKPMYLNQKDEPVEAKPKTFKEKLLDFGEKVKEKIKNFSQNILCSIKNVFNKTQKN